LPLQRCTWPSIADDASAAMVAYTAAHAALSSGVTTRPASGLRETAQHKVNMGGAPAPCRGGGHVHAATTLAISSLLAGSLPVPRVLHHAIRNLCPGANYRSTRSSDSDQWGEEGRGGRDATIYTFSSNPTGLVGTAVTCAAAASPAPPWASAPAFLALKRLSASSLLSGGPAFTMAPAGLLLPLTKSPT
jgi:transposase